MCNKVGTQSDHLIINPIYALVQSTIHDAGRDLFWQFTQTMKYREGNNYVGDFIIYGFVYTHLDVYYQAMQCSFKKAWEQCYKWNMQATNHCRTWKCFVVCQDIGNTWSNLLDVHSSLRICQFQERKQNSISRFSFSKLILNCFFVRLKTLRVLIWQWCIRLNRVPSYKFILWWHFLLLHRTVCFWLLPREAGFFVGNFDNIPDPCNHFVRPCLL